jgi:[ribosomal protein S18]-alanine N-acetyltransferase
MTIRPMRWWDIEPVLVIENELFADDAWSAGMFWSELAQPDTRHYVVATQHDGIVGYAGLAAVDRQADVQTIAVTASHQGRGLGAALLTDLLTEADRRGVTSVGLEVRADNGRAQQLYARFGFERVGVRRRYYQPSNVDALVMVRRGVHDGDTS